MWRVWASVLLENVYFQGKSNIRFETRSQEIQVMFSLKWYLSNRWRDSLPESFSKVTRKKYIKINSPENQNWLTIISFYKEFPTKLEREGGEGKT